MTNEQKQLLLKDLCARLPYGVKVNFKDVIHTINALYDDGSFWLDDKDDGLIEDLKPYLRPMSSMTKEEKQKYYNLTHQEDDDVWAMCLFDRMVDFCNERHLDYRGLIPMGLALEAPEEMYKEKQL